METITISAAVDWWLLARHESGRWYRLPLVAWALVAAGGAPFTVGQVVGYDGETVELAEPGRYVFGEQFPSCACSTPTTEIIDVGFCTYCGSVVRS